VETQVSLDRGRPDMRIVFNDKNGNRKWILCEHKLGAGEGYKQLSNYRDSLERRIRSTEKAEKISDGKLVFITDYYPDDIQRSHCHKCLRWTELYPYIIQWSLDAGLFRSDLVRQFIRYLEELGMKMPETIRPEQIKALMQIPDIWQLLDACQSGECWEKFLALRASGFYIPEIPRPSVPKEEVWYYGYKASTDNSEIWIAIVMSYSPDSEELLNTNYPDLTVEFYCNTEHLDWANDFKKSIGGKWIVKEYTREVCLWVRESLKEFLGDGKEVAAVQSWFATRLDEFIGYLRQHPLP
jgi:hypothetical protein